MADRNVNFNDLEPHEQTDRLNMADAVVCLLREWSGPDAAARLSDWQQRFMSGLFLQITNSEGRCRISDKQWARFNEIMDIMDDD